MRYLRPSQAVFSGLPLNSRPVHVIIRVRFHSPREEDRAMKRVTADWPVRMPARLKALDWYEDRHRLPCPFVRAGIGARDCQWIQRLHKHGLLPPIFQPDEATQTLRDYVRQRGNLVRLSGQHIQRM